MRAWTAVLVLVALAAPPLAAEPLTAEAVGQRLGFDADAKRRLLAGEIVATETEETTARQLAIVVALLVKGDRDQLATALLEGQTLEANPAVLDFGRIDPEAAEASLASVAFGRDEVAEVRRLLEAQPGQELNLSSEELATLQQLVAQHDPRQAGDPGTIQAVNEAYRGILAGRLRAYLDRGLAGIAPYERGGAATDAAGELRAAAEAAELLREAAPELHQALLDFPEHQPDDVEHAFFWVKEMANDRPVFRLSHRMVQRRPDVVVLLERTFFAGHSFNGSQAVAGVLPVTEGHAVFYSNRTSSDLVAGFMQSIRQRVGRGMMRDTLIDSFRAIRTQWGG